MHAVFLFVACGVVIVGFCWLCGRLLVFLVSCWFGGGRIVLPTKMPDEVVAVYASWSVW